MSENQNEVYIRIMLDTLYKKDKLLTSLIDITREQERLLEEKEFSMDSFESLMEEKEKFIVDLNQLEDGFEALYQRLVKVLPEASGLWENIQKAQQLIRSIMDKSMTLQALEARNKERLLLYLSGKRQEIKSFKSGSKAAELYQHNMVNQHQDGQSYFLDKKK